MVKCLIAFGEAKKKRIIMGLKRRKIEGGFGFDGGNVELGRAFGALGKTYANPPEFVNLAKIFFRIQVSYLQA
jgi:hypothetical protein